MTMIEVPEGTPEHIIECQNCFELAAALEIAFSKTCYVEIDSHGWAVYPNPYEGGQAGEVLLRGARCSECGQEFGPVQCRDIAKHLNLIYVGP